jgi:antirestriction protein ArdC
MHEHVNQTIIDALKQGKVPWGGPSGFPRNILTGRRFGGIEAIQLLMAADRYGFRSPFWGMRTEWEGLGARIKDGPGSPLVVSGSSSGLRLGTVWNGDQIDGGSPVSHHVSRAVDYALVERVIANTRADIRFTDEVIAMYYYPQPWWDGDFIRICHRERFVQGPGGIGAFYHTVFHELTHWTEVRLGWRGKGDVRELRAEIAAEFLAMELATPCFPYPCRSNLRQYIVPWTRRMRRDPGLIFAVAGAAAGAVDFILSFTSRAEPRHEIAGGDEV